MLSSKACLAMRESSMFLSLLTKRAICFVQWAANGSCPVSAKRVSRGVLLRTPSKLRKNSV